MMKRRRNLLFQALFWMGCFAATGVAAAAAGSAAAVSGALIPDGDAVLELPENAAPEQVERILAGLSDEQARRLLLAELRKATDPRREIGRPEDTGGGSYLDRMEGATDRIRRRLKEFVAHIPHLPKELEQAWARLTEGAGLPRFASLLLTAMVAVAAGLGLEAIIFRKVLHHRRRFVSGPRPGGWQKMSVHGLYGLFDFMGVLLFALAALLVFLVLPGSRVASARLVFFGLLIPLLAGRFAAALARIWCSPGHPELRFLDMDDVTARNLHRYIIGFTAYTAMAHTLHAVLNILAVHKDTSEFVVLILGTALLFTLGLVIGHHRAGITSALFPERSSGTEGVSWIRQQLAAVWPWLTYGYLFLIWLLGMNKLIILETRARGAFLISLLIGPIYLVLDQASQWLVKTTIGSLKPAGEGVQPPPLAGAMTPAPYAAGEPETRYARKASMAVRVILVISLVFWLLQLWDMRIPFGAALVRAAFNIFVTLILAHVVWVAAGRFINEKLMESAPPETDKADSDVDEWGAASAADRRHTLLPLLKKILGSTIVVIVSLIVLSSIGVDIGPLLAGAGVVGLAVGFGAQKLVSDVLSGVFYLLDDAFRIGEYIEAGAVSGVVEQITLRNVMLRHHRGMLQIIPFSDLGSVTNFMRGGIVVKFDIELPYDTDIEQVRKIIKKVGAAMQEDPEMGPDFIRPLKSQGVRSVGDSVMTFRLKFTAKPGKHFIIRREAFRRITEALAKKGIHYAHRKVIVDLPEALKADGQKRENGSSRTDAEAGSGGQTLTAAGAAAIQTILAGEKKASAEKSDPGSGDF
ncbi:MAG: mechanosensitive ion channel family protein [Thermodesulfobacteriota bacterium]